MKRLALVFFALAVAASAGDHKWLKRVAAAGVCAAGAFDSITTFSAYNRDPSGHESSGLLANAQGKPSPVRFSIVKSAMCGGALWMAESRHVPSYVSLAAMAPLTITQITAGAHNMGVKAQK